MNSVTFNRKPELSVKKKIKLASRLYKKNRLHEAAEILSDMKQHGYDSPGICLMLARVYDRLAFLTGEPEYEDRALDEYDSIINYHPGRFRRKALKLQNRLAKRISKLSEDEQRAQSRAALMESEMPRSPKAWFMLGANFSVRKDPFFVINAYENALKLNPEYILALFRIGYIYQHNLQDYENALSFYHRIIKIPPYADEIEPVNNNVRTIRDTLCEMSEIYMKSRNFKKVISVFDHTMKFVSQYRDLCPDESIKKVISNAAKASEKMNSSRALRKYVLEKYGHDFDNLLKELRLA